MIFERGFKEEELKSALMTVSMFAVSRLIILENPSEDFFLENINLTEDVTFVIWIDHELTSTKKILKFVSKVGGQIVNFPERKETSIFPFLDLLATRNPKAFVELKKIKQEGADTFYILTMILYLLRNLVATPKKAPSFVQEKLAKQRKNFSKKQVRELYKNVLEIDYKLKTGQLDKNQADFLLINMFMD